MASRSTSKTQLQKCQLRLLQLLLLGPLFWLLTDPEQRREYLPWLVTGASGVVVLLFLLELSRPTCRTLSETISFLIQVSWTLCRTLIQFITRGFKPKFPKWTLRFELVRGIMRTTANMFGDRIVDKHQAPVIRWHSELFGSFFGWFARRQHGLVLEPMHFNGLEHLWLKLTRVQGVRTASKRLVVLFYHGGGYAVLSPRMYIPFCSDLLVAIKRELSLEAPDNDIGVDIFLANYRKVPEHKFPAPAEDAVTMYQYLLQHEKLDPSQIILVGDSAGGGLVMSTLLRVRDGKSSWKSNLPLPLAAIVACPLADLSGDDDKNNCEHCVLSPSIISASIEAYRPASKDPIAWADASPVHCDLRGLPPVLLQAATLDYLYQHSLRVFMVFPGFILPDACIGVRRMAEFATTQFLGGAAMKDAQPNKLDSKHTKAPPAAA